MNTPQYERFQSKLNNLKDSLKLIDDALSHYKGDTKQYSIKEINLARSILIRNMHISTFALFEKYIKETTNFYLKRKYNELQASQSSLIKETLSIDKIEFSKKEIRELLNNPQKIIIDKILKELVSHKKDEDYISFIEKIFTIQIEKTLKEDIQLYIAMRHVFVHEEGQAFNEIIKTHSKTIYRNQIRFKTKKGLRYLPTNYANFKEVIEGYKKICLTIDQAIIKTPTEAGV